MSINQEKRAAYRQALERFRILLPGIPARSNRGWFGCCAIVLFQLDGDWALFDTGHYNDRALLRDALDRCGIQPANIHHVILSHLHFDHVLNLPLFQNAEIILCEAEVQYAEEVDAGIVQDDAIPDFWSALLEGHKVHTFKDALAIGKGLEVVRLPGHTPGCLSLFYTGTPAVAACGDVIKNGWEIVSGAAPSQNFDEDLSRESINGIKQREGVIIPGHDRPFVLREEGLEYLAAYSWEIYGNIFPRPQNETVYKLDLQRGFYPRP